MTIAELKAELKKDAHSKKFVQLGQLLRQYGHAEEAIGVLKAGLVHYPELLAAKLELGRCLFEEGELSSAKSLLEEAYYLSSDSIVLKRLLAQIYQQAGSVAQAQLLWTELLEIDPSDQVARQAINLTKQQDKTAPISLAKQELGAASHADLQSATLARLYSQQGHYPKSLEIYEKLFQKYPHDLEYTRAVESLRKKLSAATAQPNRLALLRGMLDRVKTRKRLA